MPQSRYFIDILIPNEGEVDSALEIGVLRYVKGENRPVVYMHSYIKPLSPQRIRWVNAIEHGINRDKVSREKFPTLKELIAVNFFTNKNVVCLNPNIEPFASFVKDSTSVQSIQSLWQDVFEGDEEAEQLTKIEQMLEYLDMPVKDDSGSRFTPLLSRLHAMVAIWDLLTEHKNKKLDLKGSLNLSTIWPIKSPDKNIIHNFADFSSMPSSAINTLFSEDLSDYLNWYEMQIFSFDWVFNRKAPPSTKHLKNKVAMAEYIYLKVLSDQMKLWVLIFYSIYNKKTSFAKEIALKRGDLKHLPVSIRDDFSSFLITHLDEFLTTQQQSKLIESMIYHSMADRAIQNFESFDFDTMFADFKKNKKSALSFKTVSIKSNTSIKCFKEISNANSILYRRYEITGDEAERYECLVKVNELFSEFKREIKKPLSLFWFNHELQGWIQYITGIPFKALSSDPSRSDDEKLIEYRNMLLQITMKYGDRWAKDLHSRLSHILEELKVCKEFEKSWSFVFQGISVEVVFKVTKVPLYKRLLRF